MKLHRVLFVVAAGLLVAADAKEDLKKELDKLKGNWSVTAVEVPKGEKGPSDNELKQLKVVFTDDKMSIKFGDEEDKPATYKLDPSKKPKEIDATRGDKTLKGIYALEGDTLKICFSEKGERPKEFKADADTRAAVMTLQRAKK